VVEFGDLGDAVDVMIGGKPKKSDVVIIRYEEGEYRASLAACRIS
jgi:hypothetical protein